MLCNMKKFQWEQRCVQFGGGGGGSRGGGAFDGLPEALRCVSYCF